MTHALGSSADQQTYEPQTQLNRKTTCQLSQKRLYSEKKEGSEKQSWEVYLGSLDWKWRRTPLWGQNIDAGMSDRVVRISS